MWLLLLALVMAGCKSEAPADDDDGDARRSKKTRRADDDGDDERDERDERKVLKELRSWVLGAQEAVYKDGDHQTYWKIYGAEAQVVHARREQPHPYDFVVPAKRTVAFHAVRDGVGKVSPAKGYEQRIENVSEKMDGDKAVLSWEVHASWKGSQGTTKAVFGERYTLLRSEEKERWRVSEKRSWTQSMVRPARENERAAHPNGVEIVFDDAYYARLDANVDRARLTGGANLFWALIDASRTPEAYQLAKTFVAAKGATGQAFYLLGAAAERLHYGEETKAAYAKARALDPRIYPPRPWGPPPPQQKQNEPSPFLDLIRPASAATL